MDLSMNPRLEPKAAKQKQRSFIDPLTKSRLIKSVIHDQLPIYQVKYHLSKAAILHGVKYSTAKHILRNQSQDVNHNSNLQKKRRKKQLLNSLSVVVDISTGQVKISRMQTNRNPSPHDEQDVVMLSQSIHSVAQMIKTEVRNQTYRFGEIFLFKMAQLSSLSSKILYLKDILQLQHSEMLKGFNSNL